MEKGEEEMVEGGGGGRGGVGDDLARVDGVNVQFKTADGSLAPRGSQFSQHMCWHRPCLSPANEPSPCALEVYMLSEDVATFEGMHSRSPLGHRS